MMGLFGGPYSAHVPEQSCRKMPRSGSVVRGAGNSLDSIPTGLYSGDKMTAKTPIETRKRLLEAAFLEFYVNGFQGGSLNHIVEQAGATKGALFHHFDGKHELGYAVVDDVIGPTLLQRWLDPLQGTSDPLTALQQTFRSYVNADIENGNIGYGCPMNNLAQEMSPLDDGFLCRLNGMYDTWRTKVAEALERGKQAGTVKQIANAPHAAALIVAAQMGIWGSGKSSQRAEVMHQATEGLCSYLEDLRA
jgi:TetR/AcrR family transcriptional regulator, transcriptional repressor for nem operon